VREFIGNLFAVAIFVAVLAFMAFMCGITLEGILYGHWPDSDDHPTNCVTTLLSIRSQTDPC
jgi:hypothetical protein